MNLKKTLFGFGAATILSLSMVSGALAANTDSIDGAVVLESTYCSVTLDQANVSYGTWTWNGDIEEYQHTAGNNAQTISGKLTAGSPNGDCNLKLSFDGLKNTSGDTIDATHFGAAITDGPSMNPISAAVAAWLANDGTVNNVAAGSGSATITLNSVPDDYDPGTYSGTFSIQITQTN